MALPPLTGASRVAPNRATKELGFACKCTGRRGNAWVHFDRDERAIGKRFTPVERTGFLDRVLAWLGF
jgi:hypothetical protein